MSAQLLLILRIVLMIVGLLACVALAIVLVTMSSTLLLDILGIAVACALAWGVVRSAQRMRT